MQLLLYYYASVRRESRVERNAQHLDSLISGKGSLASSTFDEFFAAIAFRTKGQLKRKSYCADKPGEFFWQDLAILQSVDVDTSTALF